MTCCRFMPTATVFLMSCIPGRFRCWSRAHGFPNWPCCMAEMRWPKEYRHLQACVNAIPCCRRLPVRPVITRTFGGFELRWERHTEFSTYTFIHRADGPGPFQRTALSLLPAGWLAGLPGKVISGLHVDVLAMPEPAPVGDSLRHHFEGQRLISSWVDDRKARLWTAYRIHNDGLGRVLVLNRGLNPCQLGRLVRRCWSWKPIA
jgi:hypothetical protein